MVEFASLGIDLRKIPSNQPRQFGGSFSGLNRDLDRALSALNAIPPDLPHDQWVKAGMALQAAGGTFDDFDQWSAGADSYNAQVCRTTFRSFKTLPGGVGAATLFHMARDHGWTEGTQQPAPARVTRPAQPPRKPAPGMDANEVWERCVPATADHPYIVSKGAAGVPLDALRVVPAGDPLRIVGESMVGALVVPCMAADGNLSTLQFITPPDVAGRLKAKGKPGKLNLTGCPVEGWFTVGTVAPGAVAYIVEGVGAAWSCWQATRAAAVVSFGAGNMGKVAHEMRQRDATACLVLVPDAGKEDDARKIAAEVGAAVAAMPEGEADNFDANDLAQRDGNDVLQLLLAAATEPLKLAPKVHELAKFVDFDGTVKPPRWVIPGFIAGGVTVISGSPGVGKTTVMLPLAMTAAGLHGDPLMPRQWRHVVYITEDIEQAHRILAGIVGDNNLNISLNMVRDRLHLVKAVRLDPVYVSSVGTTYREQFTRKVGDVEVLPLVVIDTKSAVLATENENDNAEASAMMAAMKQGFDDLPVWLIGHVAKANLGRSDVATLSSRGAGAIEGDSNANIFLILEKESRYLVLGKKRFDAKWPELEVASYTSRTTAQDEFGNLEEVVLLWGIAVPPQISRKEASEQAKTQEEIEADATLRQEVRDAIDTAWRLGNPLNRERVKAKIRRNASAVVKVMVNLLSEQWIYEVFIPPKDRVHPARSSFLINLDTVEHEALLRDGVLPEHKLVVLQSWKKQPIPPIPEVDQSADDSAGDAL